MDLIVVQTTSELAAAARAGREPEQLQRILESARELGVDLAPQHPGLDDPELSRYLAGPVEDRAELAAERLRALDGVDAAYVQPTPALP
jgi:sugar phosphate isomerase/epimerase